MWVLSEMTNVAVMQCGDTRRFSYKVRCKPTVSEQDVPQQYMRRATRWWENDIEMKVCRIMAPGITDVVLNI